MNQTKIFLVKWESNGSKNISMFLKIREAIDFSIEKKTRIITKYIEENFLQDVGERLIK